MATSITTWGGGGLGTIRVRSTDSKDIAASIARRLGLKVITLRSAGKALDRRGDVEAYHFVTTVGTPVPSRYGGGLTPRYEVWFSIPV